MRFKLALAAGAALMIAGGSLALARQETPAPKGYLPAGALDTAKVLPPAPADGSAIAEADRRFFLDTRKLKDTPRWALAQNDVDEKAILADYSCALGLTPTQQTTPKLVSLLMKISYDVGAAVNGPKDLYKRKRPYLVDEGPICVDKTAGLAASPDYPSGHSTWGWTVGLILAEASPEQATPVLARARAFGESRLVCGVHNQSSVMAGEMNAASLVAALHRSAAFRSDVDAIRAELAAARAAGPAPDKARCDAEAALVAQPLL
jgi:acid phosphatase (class A)